MREIKFRAWVNGWMRFPPPVADWDFEDCQLVADYIGKGEVMQYTGLKDKNGKEDWQDDIVRVKIGQVIYNRRLYQAGSGAWVVDLPCLNSSGGTDQIMLYTLEHDNIGNIYENEELLSEPKENT